ncbi:MAG TPA: exopolysaccharide biosynthesis protein [Devosia sp.]
MPPAEAPHSAVSLPDADNSRSGHGGESPLQGAVGTVIQRLETFASEPGAKLTCQHLIEIIGPRSHALALLVFSLLNLLPAPPGYNFMVGLVMIGLAVLMTLDRPIHLWGFVGHRRLPLKPLVRLLGVVGWLTHLVSRISKPRLLPVTSRHAIPVLGMVSVVLGTALLAPIPFTNMLPSMSVALVSVGILNRDGLLVLLALVVGLAGIVFVVVAVWLLLAFLVTVEQALFC